jgi:hypothetical protein
VQAFRSTMTLTLTEAEARAIAAAQRSFELKKLEIQLAQSLAENHKMQIVLELAKAHKELLVAQARHRRGLPPELPSRRPSPAKSSASANGRSVQSNPRSFPQSPESAPRPVADPPGTLMQSLLPPELPSRRPSPAKPSASANGRSVQSIARSFPQSPESAPRPVADPPGTLMQSPLVVTPPRLRPVVDGRSPTIRTFNVAVAAAHSPQNDKRSATVSPRRAGPRRIGIAERVAALTREPRCNGVGKLWSSGIEGHSHLGPQHRTD